jgi:hypothetical protein
MNLEQEQITDPERRRYRPRDAPAPAGDNDQAGSCVRSPEVPLHDEVDIGTVRRIAEQAGAKDFDEFCAWIERNR